MAQISDNNKTIAETILIKNNKKDCVSSWKFLKFPFTYIEKMMSKKKKKRRLILKRI